MSNMITKVQNYLEDEVSWIQTSNPSFPYEANVNGDNLVVRLNDFPDQNLYTLLVNDEELANFDEWPQHWMKS
ncbi:MAG: hypothetical protein ACXW18_09175 [Pyrinomonadaceae bacterium]